MLKKALLVPLYLGIAFYVPSSIFLFVYQESFIFPADKTDFYNCKELENSEKITSGSMRAYFTKRSSENIIVYYHGNGGRACDRYYMDEFFGKLGYSTLLVEYPGYAELNTKTTMKKIQKEVIDVDTFIKQNNFKHIVVAAESLGAGPATYQVYLKNLAIDKLILITPYNNMATVASLSFPMYPVKLLLRNNFTPDEWLGSSTVPTTLILAENDEVVGFAQGKKLFESMPQENKKLHIVKDAGHNSIYLKAELFKILTEALQK